MNALELMDTIMLMHALDMGDKAIELLDKMKEKDPGLITEKTWILLKERVKPEEVCEQCGKPVKEFNMMWHVGRVHNGLE